MSIRFDPMSRTGQALRLLNKQPDVTVREFHALLCKVCPDKASVRQLSDDLKARGYIERRVVLTRAAKERAYSDEQIHV